MDDRIADKLNMIRAKYLQRADATDSGWVTMNGTHVLLGEGGVAMSGGNLKGRAFTSARSQKRGGKTPGAKGSSGGGGDPSGGGASGSSKAPEAESGAPSGKVKASSGLYVSPEVEAKREKCDQIAKDEMPPKTLSTAYDDKVSKAEKQANKYLKQAVKNGEVTKEQEAKIKATEKETIETAKQAFEKQDFCIDANADVLSQVLDDGFFKCQEETGTGDAVINPDIRRHASSTLYGIDKDAPAEYFEKYGHLGNGMTAYGLGHGNDMDGQVQLVLNKDRVRDRTTFTAGDSLDQHAQPCKVTDPKISAFGRNNYTPGSTDPESQINSMKASAEKMLADGHASRVSYCELQFHGRLTTSDFAMAKIQDSLMKTDRGKAIAKKCLENGLRVMVVDSTQGPSKFGHDLYEYTGDDQ